MNLKWKDIYNNNKQRRYCEVTGIKKEDVEVISNSFRFLKEKKYIAIITVIIVLAILVYTFKSNINVLLIVIAFFALAGICFFVFNYFKLKCLKDGLYIKFGMQEGVFPYSRVKSVYLSRFNDYSFLLPAKTYSIVVRYTDNNNMIKELSFPNYFVSKEDMQNFLDNFNIKEAEENRYVQYERFKLFKKLVKIIAFILFAMFIVGLLIINGK